MKPDRWPICAASLCIALGAVVRCLAEPAATQTKQTDWCEVTVPKTIQVGEKVELRAKLTGAKEKLWVSCDLKNQDNEMVKWGGAPRQMEPGQELTWSLLVRDVPNLDAVYALILARRNEKDDWQQAVAQASSPHIKVTGRHPLVDLTYRKSWIWVDASNGDKPLMSGDTWEVPIEYSLDPADHWQKTTLYVWGTGPWIDTPDGKYATKRGHIGYGGLGARLDLTEPGKGTFVAKFRVPKGLDLVRRNNRVLLIVGFRDAAGQTWPWHHRANNSFVRKRGFFEIETEVPGNLFTYEQPVRIGIRLKNVRQPGAQKVLRFSGYNTRGERVINGTQAFTVDRDGQRVWLDLAPKGRGVFLLECGVDGWEKRITTFARIPDLRAITKGQPTRFGMTNHYDAPPEEVWAIAQRLGLNWCRRFTRWYRLNPGPGVYRLDDLERELDTAAKHGVRVWLCIGDPPPHAFPGKPEAISYRAFDFDEAAWRDFVKAATARLKGKILGWEWLNEITPGGCEDPVGTYVSMCRIGTETAKAIDPKLTTILAGGLYPRAFRNAVLTAGVGEYVDALPVHYQNGDGILEARQDLDAAGHRDVAVWEDESARGRNAWGVPPLEELQNTEQADWVLRQWTDELAAGCEKIIYFGGKGLAAGSHDYLLDDHCPRPVAATLAVFTSKLFHAQPLGVFLLGKGGLLHLFEREGKPVLVASTYEQNGETVRLHAGSESVTVTDYQGNESRLPAKGGAVDLALTRLPFFVEGASLGALKAYVVPEVQVVRVGAGTSANVAQARRIAPRVTMVRGAEGKLALRLRNLYDGELKGTVEFHLPTGWPAKAPQSFALAPGHEDVLHVSLTIPADAAPKDEPLRLTFAFQKHPGVEQLRDVLSGAPGGLPLIEKAVVVSVISPDMLGNLMLNGDFETANAAGDGPEGFAVNGKTKSWGVPQGLHDGLGKHVLRFDNTGGNWEHCGRTIPLRGGQTYLYTAWVCNRNMGAGSNMTQHLADGKEIRLYDTQVMRAGDNNPHWQMFVCRKEMPEDTERVSFTPVVNGAGWALFDNIRVTLFEGSDFVAEAHRAPQPLRIDGNLDDWVKKCPIPLIGRSQLHLPTTPTGQTRPTPDYTWSPDNLSAIGYLMWDDANLYVALNVRDDRHHATGSGQAKGAAYLEGDSVILAVDPTKRGADAEAKSFAYYLASTVPGGGSGKHTLFRPKEHSGGRTTGHLFRDSSIYDMAVAQTDGGCVYELRIPFGELGVQGALGTKIGLSLQLNDNDGNGSVAHMNWGGGLHPSWYPRGFGIVTIVH